MPSKALTSIEKAISVYEENQVWLSFHPPEYLFILASQVYRVNHQTDKADEYLRRAYERLMLAEGNIKDDDLRNSLLENVRWNREILAEAKTYGIALNSDFPSYVMFRYSHVPIKPLLVWYASHRNR